MSFGDVLRFSDLIEIVKIGYKAGGLDRAQWIAESYEETYGCSAKTLLKYATAPEGVEP